jgi:putative ABC transport system permease protein
MFNHYLTTALRHFRRHKLTTSINVVCLTIGILCFLVSYAMVTFLSSGDSHYPNADRTYMIRWAANDSLSASSGPWMTGKYLRTDMPELETVARASIDVGIRNEAPISSGDKKSFAQIAYADAEFLDVFALPFLSGDSRNALRSPRSAVLSNQTAVKFFGNATDAVGGRLRLQDGSELTVRGVVGELKQPSHLSTGGGASIGQMRFDVLVSMDVFEAVAENRELLTSWNSPLFLTYAVLPKDGSFTADDLRQRLSTFAQRHADSGTAKYRFDAISLSDYWISNIGVFSGGSNTSTAGAAMFYFMGLVVLLISCVNYANLATAQGASRAKEIGMRRVVGAKRWQVATQFLSEAAVMSCVALLCSVLLAGLILLAIGSSAIAAVVLATLATAQFWLTLVGILAIVTVIAGFYPAFVVSNVKPIQAIRTGKLRTGGRFMSRLLVGSQFAGASFLMIAMIVTIAQNNELKRSSSNQSASTLVSIANDVRAAGVDFDVLKAELLRQSHVKSVTGSILSPWVLIGGQGVFASAADSTSVRKYVMQNRVHHDYFSTMQIEVLAGRVFDREHANDNSNVRPTAAESIPASVVVDRAFAEQQGWQPLSSGIGKTIYEVDLNRSSAAAVPRTVVGIVESQTSSIVSPMGAKSSVYRLVPAYATLPIIRIEATDMALAIKQIETVWERLAPSVALKIEFADEVLARNYKAFEIVSMVFGAIAGLALLISLLGLIGMSIDVIARRRHEIGVRKTLGASVQSIVTLLLTDFSKPVVIANVLAWPLAFVVMNFYLGIFTQRIELSVLPFMGSLLMTVAIAWAAVGLQATRAARLNPATVLRYE